MGNEVVQSKHVGDRYRNIELGWEPIHKLKLFHMQHQQVWECLEFGRSMRIVSPRQRPSEIFFFNSYFLNLLVRRRLLLAMVTLVLGHCFLCT